MDLCGVYPFFGLAFFLLSMIILRFIHVITCVSGSFLFLAEEYPLVWVSYNLSIHLLMDI